jgi:hypothetical protein
MSRPLLLPDPEQVVSGWLRAQPELVELIGDRVYTAFPRQGGKFPLVLVRRYGGTPPLPRPLVLDLALIQADVYGGTKAQAWEVAATMRWLVSERARGSAGNPTIEPGSVRFEVDEAFDEPRPRYICDLTAYIRPWAAPTGSREPRDAPAEKGVTDDASTRGRHGRRHRHRVGRPRGHADAHGPRRADVAVA